MQHQGPTTPRGSPQTFGRYAILGELARGGMGVVYRARHPELGREVALKVILADGRVRAEQVERFRIEARAAARLRHPNIVAIHDVGEEGGVPFLVMDMIPGAPLSDLLEDGDALEPRRALTIAVKLARALAHAHSHSILHRDMKPSNVLLNAEDEPVITDFGLAREMDKAKRLTVEGKALGTPAYMPPEQVEGQLDRIDRRSDVYSLGATLYEMLTGERPTPSFLRSEQIPPSKLVRSLPRDLDVICLKCLEREPERRYPSAEALAEDLERFLSDRPIRARPPGLLERATRWSRRNRTFVRIAAAGVLSLLLAGAAFEGWTTQAWAESAQAEVDARRHAARELRGRLAERFAREFQESWLLLRKAAPPTGGHAQPERAAVEHHAELALTALGAANRWCAVARQDPAAADAQRRSALALAKLAGESEQWSLAAQALQQSERSAGDDSRVQEARVALDLARNEKANQRRAEVQALLALAERGELTQEPDGLANAVVVLIGLASDETVGALVERLNAASKTLAGAERDLFLEAEAPLRDEATAGEGVLPGIAQALAEREALAPGQALSREAAGALSRAADRLVRRAARARKFRSNDPAPRLRQLLGARQQRALGQGGEQVVALACEALGHMGERERAAPALARYLELEASASRAIPAGLALCRLGGEVARDALRRARQQHGLHSIFATQTARLLQALNRAEPPAGAAADPVDAMQRGQDCFARGDFDGATTALERAVALDPAFTDAWNQLGLAREKSGDYAGAISSYDRALELSPDRSGLLANRSVARMRARDLDGALADSDRAVALAPNLAALRKNRAQVRLARGEVELALEDLDQALQLDPRDAEALAVRSGVHIKRGALDAALRDLNRALEIDPRLPALWRGRGVLRIRQGRSAEAVEDLTRALELAPGDPVSLFARGVVRADLGEVAGARADLERFLEVAPRHPKASVAKETLEALRRAR